MDDHSGSLAAFLLMQRKQAAQKCGTKGLRSGLILKNFVKLGRVNEAVPGRAVPIFRRIAWAKAPKRPMPQCSDSNRREQAAVICLAAMGGAPIGEKTALIAIGAMMRPLRRADPGRPQAH